MTTAFHGLNWQCFTNTGQGRQSPTTWGTDKTPKTCSPNPYRSRESAKTSPLHAGAFLKRYLGANRVNNSGEREPPRGTDSKALAHYPALPRWVLPWAQRRKNRPSSNSTCSGCTISKGRPLYPEQDRKFMEHQKTHKPQASQALQHQDNPTTNQQNRTSLRHTNWQPRGGTTTSSCWRSA